MRRKTLVGGRCRYWLLGLVLLVGAAHAEVELPTGYYHRTEVDLVVKVLGGEVTAERTWYQGRWHFNRSWNPLMVEYDSLSGGIKAIVRNQDTFALKTNSGGSSGGSAKLVFPLDERKQIVEEDEGFRWQDREGNWIDYNGDGQALRYGDRNKVTVRIGYDSAGRRSGVFDHHGRQVLWYEYDSDDRLRAVRDGADPATARRVQYGYSDGRLTSVTDVLGKVWRYGYDAGELVSITDPDGRVTRIAYHSPELKSEPIGPLRSKTTSGGSGGTTTLRLPRENSLRPASRTQSVTLADGTGPRYVYDYDSTKKEFYVRTTESSGKVTEQWYDRDGYLIRTDVNGLTVERIEYSSNRRRKVITNELDQQTIEEYDEYKNLTKITYPDGASKSWSYDPTYSSILTQTNELGVLTRYRYDSHGNLLEKTEAVGKPAERRFTYTYDQYGQLLTETSVGDEVTETAITRYSYDEAGNVATKTDPEGHVTTYVSYDRMGNLLAWDDPRKNRWRQTYDAKGQKTGESNPLGHSWTYEYDGRGNRVKVIDPEENTTTYVYDANNRLTKIIDAMGGEIRRQYNEKGQLVTIIDQEGKAQSYRYNYLGRLATVSDGEGNTTAFSYGNSNRGVRFNETSEVVYPKFIERYTYDLRGKRVAEARFYDDEVVGARRYTYDAAGQLILSTDEENRETRYRHDALGRIAAVTRPDGSSIEYQHDRQGRVLNTFEAGNAVSRSFRYDRNGRLVYEAWHGDVVQERSYDEAGNVSRQSDSLGRVIVYGYDSANRLTRKEATGGGGDVTTSAEFSYSATGLLTGYDDGFTSGLYVYDRQGRLIQASVDYGEFEASYRFGYYKNGLKKHGEGPSGQRYEYKYDSARRPSVIEIVGKGVITYAEYDWIRPSKINLPGGVRQNYIYDSQMRINAIRVTDPAGTIAFEEVYDRSMSGRVLSRSGSDGEYRYEYDNLGRLTQVASGAVVVERYGYDSAGNRLGYGSREGAGTYNDRGQLISYGDVTFSYDRSGRTVEKQAGNVRGTYEYGADGRLAKYSSGQTVATYYYDPFGRRLSKTVGEKKEYYYYDERGLVASSEDGGVTWTEREFSGGGLWSTNPIFSVSKGKLLFFVNDQLPAVRRIVDQTGRAIWRGSYSAFGERMGDVYTDMFVLPGQYYDRESGLHYALNRYYSPSEGRFIAPDPASYRSAADVYQYASGDPVNRIDPDGYDDVAAGAAGEADDYTPCAYYESVANSVGCKYHKTAASICRGENWPLDAPGANGWLNLCSFLTRGRTTAAPERNCIRRCLVKADEAARKNPACQIPPDGRRCIRGEGPGDGSCTDKICIDGYHNTCFFECGISPYCFGGNYPYPYDNDGTSYDY